MEKMRVEREELEDVLEDLYGEGSFDSSGSFTLRADKAREKLARFQLENPFSYVVHFYSAGYMAGASSYRLSLGAWTSELEFQGATLPEHVLNDILSYLLISPVTPLEWSAHELALGLQSAPAAGVRKAVITTESCRVEIEDGKVRVGQGRGASGVTVGLFHQRSLATLWSFWVRGRRLPEMVALESAIVGGQLSGTTRSGDALSVQTDRVNVPPGLVAESTPGGYIVLGEENGLGSGRDSIVELNIRGRRFCLPVKFGRGRVRALERADSLALNLSQTEPVQTAEYLGIKRRLLDRVGELRSRLLLEHSERLSERDRKTLARQVSRGQRSRGDLDQAVALLSGMPYSESRLAALYAMRGDLTMAEELLQKDLQRSGLPAGLLPVRLLDLATLQARKGETSALDTWYRAFELLVDQHVSRKSHLVSEAIESKLLWLLDIVDEPDRAWAEWEQARDMKRHLGQEHPRMAALFERGSYLRWRMGDHRQALELATTAERIRVSHLGEGNPALGQAITLKSMACHQAGEREPALKLAERRMSMMEAVYGLQHPETAASLNLLSWLESRTGSTRSSQILAKRGIAEPFSGRVVVCFRGWFHSRSPWEISWPLAVAEFE